MPEIKPDNAGVPYHVPPEPSRLPSFLLAVAVHAALLAFLWIGVSWTAKTPITVEAEVWDMSVQTAAAVRPVARWRRLTGGQTGLLVVVATFVILYGWMLIATDFLPYVTDNN